MCAARVYVMSERSSYCHHYYYLLHILMKALHGSLNLQRPESLHFCRQALVGSDGSSNRARGSEGRGMILYYMIISYDVELKYIILFYMVFNSLV